MDFDKMLEFLQALHEEAVDYVLVGAAAMNLHGLVRATEDVDVFVSDEAANIELLRRALRRVWDDPEIDGIRADDLAGEYPVVRYGPPGEDFVIDLMSRLGEAVSFEDLDAETVAVGGVVVRIATPATLYKMKRDTVRPQDKADAEALKQRFDLQDDR